MNEFDQIVGQEEILVALRNRIVKNSHNPILLVGPHLSGKLTIARTYARAVLCQSEMKPCGVCYACRSVTENGSLRYIEMDAGKFNSHEHVQDQLKKLRAVGYEYVVWVVRNVDRLSGAVSDRLLKPMEINGGPSSVFVLLSSRPENINSAVVSRCQVYELTEMPVAGIVRDLEEQCQVGQFEYEEEALEILALAADGWIGRARRLLGKCVQGVVPLTVRNALLACGCGKGDVIVQCWLAALEGRLDEARRLSLQIAGGGLDRVVAMQAFTRSFLSRQVGQGRLAGSPSLPIYDIRDESWNEVRVKWTEFASARGQPIMNSVRELVMYWGQVAAVPHWDLIFDGFCRRLALHGSGRS